MRRVLPTLLFVAGCGDPLVGPQYEGTPRITVGGVVRQANMRHPAMHGALALSVFWIGGRAPVEQSSRLDSGFAEYTMTLFDAPPADASGFGDLVGDGVLALGVIALYADKDENGALDLATDLLLGASPQHVVAFSDRAITAEQPAGALLGAMGPGYHLFEHDRPSACTFVSAATCGAEGALVPVTDPSSIALTLWDTAEEVVVPAPALTRGAQPGTIWSATPQ